MSRVIAPIGNRAVLANVIAAVNRGYDLPKNLRGIDFDAVVRGTATNWLLLKFCGQDYDLTGATLSDAVLTSGRVEVFGLSDFDVQTSATRSLRRLLMQFDLSEMRFESCGCRLPFKAAVKRFKIWTKSGACPYSAEYYKRTGRGTGQYIQRGAVKPRAIRFGESKSLFVAPKKRVKPAVVRTALLSFLQAKRGR